MVGGASLVRAGHRTTDDPSRDGVTPPLLVGGAVSASAGGTRSARPGGMAGRGTCPTPDRAVVAGRATDAWATGHRRAPGRATMVSGPAGVDSRRRDDDAAVRSGAREAQTVAHKVAHIRCPIVVPGGGPAARNRAGSGWDGLLGKQTLCQLSYSRPAGPMIAGSRRDGQIRAWDAAGAVATDSPGSPGGPSSGVTVALKWHLASSTNRPGGRRTTGAPAMGPRARRREGVGGRDGARAVRLRAVGGHAGEGLRGLTPGPGGARVGGPGCARGP